MSYLTLSNNWTEVRYEDYRASNSNGCALFDSPSWSRRKGCNQVGAVTDSFRPREPDATQHRTQAAEIGDWINPEVNSASLTRYWSTSPSRGVAVVKVVATVIPGRTAQEKNRSVQQQGESPICISVQLERAVSVRVLVPAKVIETYREDFCWVNQRRSCHWLKTTLNCSISPTVAMITGVFLIFPT
jgi:hypothetical protein